MQVIWHDHIASHGDVVFRTRSDCEVYQCGIYRIRCQEFSAPMRAECDKVQRIVGKDASESRWESWIIAHEFFASARCSRRPVGGAASRIEIKEKSPHKTRPSRSEAATGGSSRFAAQLQPPVAAAPWAARCARVCDPHFAPAASALLRRGRQRSGYRGRSGWHAASGYRVAVEKNSKKIKKSLTISRKTITTGASQILNLKPT
jgi:hypothetical protein